MNDLKEYISVDPEILGGAPCVSGLRLPVKIVASLVEKRGIEELLDTYPYPELTIDCICACLKYMELNK